MTDILTISSPDVVALVEKAANQLTGGDKTEVVAIAVRRLLDASTEVRPLFGAHRGSVTARKDVDLTEPVFDDELDSETGNEITR